MISRSQIASRQPGVPRKSKKVSIGTPKPNGAKAASYVFVILVTIAVVAPILWMFIGSLETTKGMLAGQLIPRPFTFENFVTVLRDIPFFQYLFNSVVTTLAIIMAQVFTSALVAYALVFTQVRGRKVVFGLVLLSMMIPIQAIFIPDYVLLSKLHWINTYEALIVPWIGSGFGIFFLRQSFRQIPRALIESMKVDGASHWTILRKLVIPNSLPAITTLAILNGVFHYGYLFWPLLVTQSPNRRVLPVGLSYLVAQDRGINWNVLMAGDVLTVALPLALFVFGQKYIVKGVLGYATKG
jgi:ABC-type glycerol-3-phosphate transport system permease component